MSRRRNIVKAIAVSVIAVGAAAALLVAVSRTLALPGDSITNPDTPFNVGVQDVISVGDHVMFLGPTPTVEAGNTITITAIELNEASKDIRLIDTRIYQPKDFDNGQQQLGWHTKLDPKSDPRRRPSVPMIGTPLHDVEPRPDAFTMFEFVVCAPGDLEIRSIKVTYMDGWIRYQQLILVDYKLTNVQPSDISC